MKRILFLLFVILFAVGMALGDGPSTGTTGYTQGSGLVGYDILGAHQNGGRGCAGCHAPHSGAAGGGGNAISGAAAFNDALSGSNALFGQDVTPLLGYTIITSKDGNYGAGYVEVLPAEGSAYTTQTAELRGITMCLACHDGVVAKGQMMNGQSWEQRMGLLPSTVYGTRPIPTLLGNDSGNGNTSGYGNDHPVGVQATLAAVGVINGTAPTTGPLSITVSSAGVISNIVPNSTAYQQFNSHYGYPAIAGSVWEWGVALQATDTTGATAFITCTTCHNQHAMYVYTAPPSYAGKMAGAAIAGSGNYPTYFFINSPYNPAAGNGSANMAVSTTQFCRQCHFDTSNENSGITTVTTQF
jgi:hypothetical protein